MIISQKYLSELSHGMNYSDAVSVYEITTDKRIDDINSIGKELFPNQVPYELWKRNQSDMAACFRGYFIVTRINDTTYRVKSVEPYDD